MTRHEPHVSSKGCVVRDECILLVQYQDIGEEGFHYNLPGGRVRENEDLHQACRRKVQAETGAIVEPREILFIYEYIGKNHSFAAGDKHSISFIFRCDFRLDIEPSMETCLEPDEIQTDICWVPLEDLDRIVLFPRVERRLQRILMGTERVGEVYWGDIL